MSSYSLFKLLARPFVQFSEVNTTEDETWHHYIRLEGNEASIYYLKNMLDKVKSEGGYCVKYNLNMKPLREYEVDILVKHSGEGCIKFHTKLDGKFIFKEEIDEKLFSETFDKIMLSFMENCYHDRRRNSVMFKKFEDPVEPSKYLLIKAFEIDYYTKKETILRTAFQYNGNEKEIENFLDDWKKSKWYENEFENLDVVEGDQIEKGTEIIVGKFCYSEYLNRQMEKYQDNNLDDLLRRDGISNFIE